jgi:alkylation response protein AidB-like acyl-CoA dehydrogenase
LIDASIKETLMNFEFSEDQKFVQQTARDFLAEHAGLDVCRAVLESSRPYDADLWKGVAEMGWLGAAVPESYGGAGLGHLELVLLAEEMGRSLAPIPFSSSVYLATEALLLAGSDDQKKRYLPRLASGELVGTFALAEGLGGADPSQVETRFSEGRLSGEKLPVPDGEVAGLAVVAVRSGKGAPSLVLTELDADGVERIPVESIDPSRGLSRLRFDGAAAEFLGEAGRGVELTDHLLDRAAVLFAFEQLGGAARVLELTRDNALERYAFGRLAACNARVSATEAFELASKEMIQIFGGVGFTWEYDCHLFYRRARWLDALLGGAGVWREKLIQRIEARDAA